MTVFRARTTTPVVVASGEFTTIFQSADLQHDTLLDGITITLSGTVNDPVYRIVAKRPHELVYTVLYPYSLEQVVTSGVYETFPGSIQIPKGSTYQVQVGNSSAVALSSAGLTLLNLVEVRTA